MKIKYKGIKLKNLKSQRAEMQITFIVNWNQRTKLQKSEVLYRIDWIIYNQPGNWKLKDRSETVTFNQFKSEDPIEQNQNLYNKNEDQKRN